MNFWERNGDEYSAYGSRPTAGANSGGQRGVQDDLQSKINEFAGKSQEELMSELFASANLLKGEGRLTARDLDEFYGKVSGFLNEEQKARMRSLIEALKR